MPAITISRLFGSGGSEVAARVADTLGWALLDNALVDRVAARLGRTPVEVQAIEERVPSLAERLADALALGSPEIVSPALSAPLPPTEERLLDRLVPRSQPSGFCRLQEEVLAVLRAPHRPWLCMDWPCLSTRAWHKASANPEP